LINPSARHPRPVIIGPTPLNLCDRFTLQTGKKKPGKTGLLQLKNDFTAAF